VSEADTRRERIQSRIDISQDRLKRESEQLPALPAPRTSAQTQPAQDFRSLARQHPWLFVAAGAGAGLLVGALLPKRAGSKLGGRALGLGAAGAELAIALSRNAREAAGESARDGLNMLEEGTAPLRRRASAAAGTAKRDARSAGVRIAGEAIKFATRLRT
jgi:ElaB/YqjD/DUF883 family membrane-anchored ribosome-binding protein